jgi:excisionase family DNA binding protein
VTNDSKPKPKHTTEDGVRDATAHPPREWLTPNQTAAYLHIHPETLYKLRAAGQGPPSHRIGPRSVRYRRSDVDTYVVENPNNLRK